MLCGREEIVLRYRPFAYIFVPLLARAERVGIGNILRKRLFGLFFKRLVVALAYSARDADFAAVVYPYHSLFP